MINITVNLTPAHPALNLTVNSSKSQLDFQIGFSKSNSNSPIFLGTKTHWVVAVAYSNTTNCILFKYVWTSRNSLKYTIVWYINQRVLVPRKIGELELDFENPTWKPNWDFQKFTVTFTVNQQNKILFLYLWIDDTLDLTILWTWRYLGLDGIPSWIFKIQFLLSNFPRH